MKKAGNRTVSRTTGTIYSPRRGKGSMQEAQRDEHRRAKDPERSNKKCFILKAVGSKESKPSLFFRKTSLRPFRMQIRDLHDLRETIFLIFTLWTRQKYYGSYN
jgi:hypothetical protein